MTYRITLTDPDGQAHVAVLDAYGGAKLLAEDGHWYGDVFWVGREMVIGNGAASLVPEHNNPIRSLDGRLLVEELVDGKTITYHDADISVADGTGEYLALRPVSRLRIDPRDAWLIDWHQSNGPDDPNFEPWWLDRQTLWGPRPDDKDPGNTGSGRMVKGRLGVIHRLLREADDPIPDADIMADSQRWTADQWKRQVHYWDWSVVVNGMPKIYTAEEANADNKHRVGWGYRSAGGIDTPTYSGEPIFGRVDSEGNVWKDSSNPYPCDHGHFEMQKMLWIAVLTKSHFAMWHAIASIEANHSRKHPNTKAWWSMARSFGWTFEAETMWAKALEPYFPEVAARLWRYAEWTLSKLEGYNTLCVENGVVLPSLDGGGTGSAIEGALATMVPGGRVVLHVVKGADKIKAHTTWAAENNREKPATESPHVEEYVVEPGNKNQLRGIKTFFLGILLSGLDKAITFCPPNLRQRFGTQFDIAALAMHRTLAATVNKDLQPETRYRRNFLYLVGLCAANTSNPAGVDADFVLPGVEAAIRRYPSHPMAQVFVQWVDKLMADMQANNYWGRSSNPDKGKQAITHGPGWESARRGAIPD